ncbi:hypothetical protein UlMin_015535, partial [Ulmus minor]
KTQLGDSGKPLGSMNLDELLQNVWTSEANQSIGMDLENTSSSSSLQRQASLSLARAYSGKTVDEVWKEIQQGQRKRYGEDVKGQDREPTLGETTLEDFLNYQHKFGLSSSPSIGALSDSTTSGRKRDASEHFEKTMERRLRRKIKNRESAARSRARKQAYHNELVGKVSRLEEENLKLKKEKEFENTHPSEPSSEPKYQLRRTSSATF